MRNRMIISPSVVIMTSVACEECGANFQITHPTLLQDAALASRQARWLAEQFVWDHIQESKHRANIELPTIAGSGKQG